MQSRGVLPEDAPDPRLRLIEQLRAMPVPILGLVPQPHLEDWGSFSMSSGTSNGVMHEMTAGINYTLWRNPDDRDDPVNLAELDEETRRAVGMQTPWPRPKWLLEGVARMRYPTLWEAVRTTWRRDDPHQPTPGAELVHHVNHVLMNQYSARSARDPDARTGRPESPVDERHIEHGVPVVVNGAAVAGMRIDTDPHVFGIGADLGDAGVLTAVLDRDVLPYVVVEFASRPLNA
jgi:hypothetical protein